jgi:hypothetical protein
MSRRWRAPSMPIKCLSRTPQTIPTSSTPREMVAFLPAGGAVRRVGASVRRSADRPARTRPPARPGT